MLPHPRRRHDEGGILTNAAGLSAASRDVAAAQRSIQDRVGGLGANLGRLRPIAIVSVLGAAALWPVAAPLLGTGVAVGAAGGLMGILGGPGQRFISEWLERAARSAAAREGQPELERMLAERMEGGDAAAIDLRQGIGRLLRTVGGVDIALGAAGDGRDGLARALVELGETWQEFGWMLEQVHVVLSDIQERQIEALALQRAQLDLQREQLVKTNLLLSTQSRERIRRGPDGSSRHRRAPPAAADVPYKGLQRFEPEDARLFFGREELRAELLARVAESRLLAVSGDSGSGKSSLLRVGIVRAVWDGALPGSSQWPVAVFSPGPAPLDELAVRIAALSGLATGSVLADLQRDPATLALAARRLVLDAPPAARLLLIVDQLEELFTMGASAHDREAFLEALLAASRHPSDAARVVLAIRSDFVGRLAAHPGVAEALRGNQVLVGPLRDDELVAAIEGPAAQVGLRVEAGLADLIVDEVRHEPGALPLVSHALLETFKRRRGRTLTLEGYREAGGVRGAIAQTADATLARLTPAEQSIARTVFLRLTILTDGAHGTRGRATVDELVAEPARREMVESVVNSLVGARLLAAGPESVDIAHEALLSHWPLLRTWIDEDQEGERVRRQLVMATREWLALGRDRGALYRGARLATAEEWRATHGHELNRDERQFLDNSRKAEQDELAAARRRSRRLRLLAAALAALAIAAGLSAFVALDQAERARVQTAEAQREARIATSRRLAAEGSHDLVANTDLALLLGLEAYVRADTAEARSQLVTALQDSARLRMTLRGHRHGSSVLSAAFGKGGRLLASAGFDGTVQLWNAMDGHRVGSPLQMGHGANRVAISPDGRWLVSSSDGGIRAWDIRDEAAPRPVGARSGGATALAVGRSLVSAGGRDGRVRMLPLPRLAPVGKPLPGRWLSVTGIAVDRRGAALAAAGFGNGRIQLYDPATEKSLGVVGSRDASVSDLAISQERHMIWTVGTRGVEVWDAASGDRLARNALLTGARLTSIGLDPEHRRVAVASEDGTVRLFTDDTLRTLGPPLRGHHDAAMSVAFDPSGRLLASTGADGTVRVWDVGSAVPLATSRTRGDHERTAVAMASGGDVIALGSRDGTVSVRPGHEPRAHPAALEAAVRGMAFSADGGRLAYAGRDGTVRVWEVAADRPVGRPVSVDAVDPVIALDPTGRLLAAGALTGGAVRLWRADGGEMTTLPGGDHTISVLAFSPNGRLLAAGADDGSVHLWDVADRRALAPLVQAPEVSVDALAFAPDRRTLAVAASDGQIRVWDLAKRMQRVASLDMRGDPVSALGFSGDGSTLAAASRRTVRLWDPKRGRSLGRPLRGHDAGVRAVAFGPDGAPASVDARGAAISWDPVLVSERIDAWQDRICRMVGRGLTTTEWSHLQLGGEYRPVCGDR